MNPVSKLLFELQEISFLIWRVLVGVRRGPRYLCETIEQMDEIGVGSLVIIILTRFFYRWSIDSCRHIRRLLSTVLKLRPAKAWRRRWSAN